MLMNSTLLGNKEYFILIVDGPSGADLMKQNLHNLIRQKLYNRIGPGSKDDE